jgi:hypothetical protein
VGVKSVEYDEMGHREIVQMDVIANASAVGCGIVRAEDGNSLFLPQSYLVNQGNQMRLGVMMLSMAIPRSRSIEVAQYCISNAVDLPIPGKDAFNLKL